MQRRELELSRAWIISTTCRGFCGRTLYIAESITHQQEVAADLRAINDHVRDELRYKLRRAIAEDRNIGLTITDGELVIPL